MCKILIGITKNPKDKLYLSAYRNLMPSLNSEKDGISALFYEEKKVKVVRSLDAYEKILKQVSKALPSSPLTAIHTRTATSGGITLENTHFFQHGNYFMCHNGTVPHYCASYDGYSRNGYPLRQAGFSFVPYHSKPKQPTRQKLITEYSKLTDIMERCSDCRESTDGWCRRHTCVKNRLVKLDTLCYEEHGETLTLESDLQTATEVKIPDKPETKNDSRLFLEKIKKPITAKILEKEIKATSFWGLGFIWNWKKHTGWLIAEKTAYALYPKNGAFLILTSFPIIFPPTRKELFGVKLQEEESDKDYIISTIAGGIHSISR